MRKDWQNKLVKFSAHWKVTESRFKESHKQGKTMTDKGETAWGVSPFKVAEARPGSHPAGEQVRAPPEEVGKPAAFTKACAVLLLLAGRRPRHWRVASGRAHSTLHPHNSAWARTTQAHGAQTVLSRCSNAPFPVYWIRFWSHWRMLDTSECLNT